MCQRPRKQKKTQDTNVLFIGTVKLPNSAFCISKTTILISNKFTYFLPYIYTTSHIKIEENSFSSSWDICSWKLPDFLHIFLLLLLCTKLQIYLSCIKITFACFNFFQIWNTYKAHWGLHFPKILRNSTKNEWSTDYNITIFFTICRRTYRMHHQCYGSENFSQQYHVIKSGPFWRIFKLE